MSWFEGLVCLIGTLIVLVCTAVLRALPFIIGGLILYWLIF
nr:MAG TPA: ATP synthase subunit 9 [Caudoviricetes sp.]